MKLNSSITAALAATTLAVPALSQTLTFYHVESAIAVDLGTLGGDEAEARNINNNGAIVGWAAQQQGVHRAFYYANNEMKAIGPAIPGVRSYATAVNDNGEVVGSYEDFYKEYPFYWHASAGYSRMRDKAYHAPGFTGEFVATPFAINLHGTIVGDAYFWDDGPAPEAAPPCYSKTAVRWLKPLSFPSSLYCPSFESPYLTTWDINNSGEIVVTDADYTNAVGIFVGFVFEDGIRNRVPHPEGLLGVGSSLQAFGINESGNIVGATCCEDRHAIFWNRYSAESEYLGDLPGGDESEAYQINDANFVVGYSKAAIPYGIVFQTIRSRAFLWHKKFGMYQLPVPSGFTPIATDCVAFSLNNRVEATGLIQAVGYCTKSGKSRAVRWSIIVSKQTVQIGM